VKTNLEDRIKFFEEHAGWSYDPKTETSEEGRHSNAIALALAEAQAKKEYLSYVWTYDDIDTSSFEDTDNPHVLWICALMPENETYNCGIPALASLGGIDLGADGRPCSDPYAKVIEAELALEYLSEL
jgi:hypothetical protein